VTSKSSSCGCTFLSFNSSNVAVSYIIHYGQSIYIIQSTYIQKQNINSPASQQAASRQAARTSAAASAAPSAVSIQLRASTVLTLFHTQASLRQRQSNFPAQRGAMAATGSGARHQSMTIGVGWSYPSSGAGRRITLRQLKPGRQ
jgi:hypothetical protein